MNSAGRPRLPLIDALKVVASQLIVLHHLAFYGPMADHAAPLMPGLVDWFAEQARIAVQIFLVVGGFLAVQRLAPAGRLQGSAQVLPRLVERYLRLVLPLALALLLAVAAAAVARLWMDHESVPSAPRALQVAAHLLLAQDLFDQDALSAGIWYVAIDFQLYAALLVVLALTAAGERRMSTAVADGLVHVFAPWVVALAVTASAIYFNRQADWDVAAPYFMAAHGLGVLAAWSRAGRGARAAWWFAVAMVVLGLGIEWRERLALALLLALALWAWERGRHRAASQPAPTAASQGRVVRTTIALGQSSYAMFLVHFPVCLVVNAAFDEFVPHAPWPQAVGLVLAWAASVVAGGWFHRHAERPLTRWLAARRGGSLAPLGRGS